MGQPARIQNSSSQTIDTIYDVSGNPLIKIAVGDKTLGSLTPHAGWQGVASHQDDDDFVASDGVSVVAGVDPDTGKVVKLLVDAAGILHIEQMAFNGATFARLRTPTIFTSFSAVTITSETTIWTPASGKKFRLMGFVITQTVATGDIALKDGTGLSTILTVPATPVGQPLAVPLGNGILSGAADRVLSATGASTEKISGFVYGTEE